MAKRVVVFAVAIALAALVPSSATVEAQDPPVEAQIPPAGMALEPPQPGDVPLVDRPAPTARDPWEGPESGDDSGGSARALLPCQLAATSAVFHVGFPQSDFRVPSTGDAKIAALFVEFPNAAARQTTHELLEQNGPEVDDYFAQVSYGRLNIEISPLHEWLLMPYPHGSYGLENGASASEARRFFKDALSLADPLFDFTGVDAVWVFVDTNATTVNRSFAQAFTNPLAGFRVENGAVSIMNLISRDRDFLGSASPAFDLGEAVMVHESFHTLGLPDLYNYAWDPNNFATINPFVGNFGPLGNIAGRQGGIDGAPISTRNGNEPLAWNRWLMGWLDEDQIDCVQSYPTITSLTPISELGGTKAAVVKLSGVETVVVEARTQVGYDVDMEAEGVLVYGVKSSVSSGQGPIRVRGEYTGDWADGSVLLQPGEAMVVSGVYIGVIARTAAGFEVQIGTESCAGKQGTIDMAITGSGIGTQGPDVIIGTPSRDVINGRGGADKICSGEGPDVVHGGAHSDTIDGGRGADFIRGGGGADIIFGADGPDRLLGLGGGDRIDGGRGNDQIIGHGGNDKIEAGLGDDTVTGGGGSDVIDGGAGNDLIRGQNGADTLRGGDGDDVLSGGSGDDVLSGGDGVDDCRGNTGTDLGDAASCEQTTSIETLF